MNEKQKLALDQIFKMDLPQNLFETHYSLSQKYRPTKPEHWRQYLKDNEHFITSETAAIAEAQARKALNSLGNGATAQEVSAIKALLEKSKLINDAQKQQQHVLLTYLPTKGQLTDQKHNEERIRFLEDYLSYVIALADSNQFIKQIHTEEWFQHRQKEMQG